MRIAHGLKKSGGIPKGVHSVYAGRPSCGEQAGNVKDRKKKTRKYAEGPWMVD